MRRRVIVRVDNASDQFVPNHVLGREYDVTDTVNVGE
jgi:hypothetical protein